jgi:hypothetical protein
VARQIGCPGWARKHGSDPPRRSAARVCGTEISVPGRQTRAAPACARPPDRSGEGGLGARIDVTALILPWMHRPVDNATRTIDTIP